MRTQGPAGETSGSLYRAASRSSGVADGAVASGAYAAPCSADPAAARRTCWSSLGRSASSGRPSARRVSTVRNQEACVHGAASSVARTCSSPGSTPSSVNCHVGCRNRRLVSSAIPTPAQQQLLRTLGGERLEKWRLTRSVARAAQTECGSHLLCPRGFRAKPPWPGHIKRGRTPARSTGSEVFKWQPPGHATRAVGK